MSDAIGTDTQTGEHPPDTDSITIIFLLVAIMVSPMIIGAVACLRERRLRKQIADIAAD